MARYNGSRNTQKLRSSYKALQQDLSSVIEDLEAMAASGKDVGLEKAKEKIDQVQEQVESLLGDTVERAVDRASESTEYVRRSVAENPWTVIAAAFATGIAAASLLQRRR
jgi:ElaB/YqjD/DUF883 family membrane-anchored ribosome-binding protein